MIYTTCTPLDHSASGDGYNLQDNPSQRWLVSKVDYKGTQFVLLFPISVFRKKAKESSTTSFIAPKHSLLLETMGQSFKDSGRYASVHAYPQGPGDGRPSAQQIIQDENLVGKLKDKTILITGGSSGIGIEEVRSLASTGASIIFTARDMAKGEKVKASILEDWKDQSVKPEIEILKMDLQSLESVREAAEEFKKNHDNLHVLIGNAGIGLTPYKLVSDLFGTKVISHFYYIFEATPSYD